MAVEVGFLFDNDGVLVRSEKFHWLAWQQLCTEEGKTYINHDSFLQGFGKRNDLILEEAVPELTVEERVKLAERKEELFRNLARGNVCLLDGMERFLQEIQKEKVPCIIASSTSRENLEMYLSTTPLGRYFDNFVSAEEVSRGKPHPDVFLAAAKRLRIDPCNCVVFEDAPAGVKAGKKAGCFVVGLLTTHKEEKMKECDLIVEDPSHLHLPFIMEAFGRWQKRQKILRPLRKVFGAFLVLIGVVFIFVPIFPSVLFIAVGLVYLNIPRVQKFIDSLQEKWQKMKNRRK